MNHFFFQSAVERGRRQQVGACCCRSITANHGRSLTLVMGGGCRHVHCVGRSVLDCNMDVGTVGPNVSCWEKTSRAQAGCW
jgi:hypothetical protein